MRPQGKPQGRPEGRPQGRPQGRPLYTPRPVRQAPDGRAAPPSGADPRFDALTAVQPRAQFVLETVPAELSMRVLDLFTPIGKGTRGLIISPPRAGKTTVMQKIAHAILRNSPTTEVLVLLIDERPEEATECRVTLRGTPAQVFASTNDLPANRHIALVREVLARAKKLVVEKRDVVVLFDSLTRMTRAYNNELPQRGRTMSGGLDAAAFAGPRAFFGAARNVEEGGSLTILGTVLVDTGSRMDQIIFEEFKGTGNSEIYLSRELAERRVFPAIDLLKSGTRREELLLAPADLERIVRLRRRLAERPPLEAMSALLAALGKTQNNAEFLRSFE
ncbi:MAG: transcription termination factor Rho [Planctomycetes bacterium]|nr:transcription termination factor Rho [Planctomycetota bacterium]